VLCERDIRSQAAQCWQQHYQVLFSLQVLAVAIAGTSVAAVLQVEVEEIQVGSAKTAAVS
jgi:hypothetical protein